MKLTNFFLVTFLPFDFAADQSRVIKNMISKTELDWQASEAAFRNLHHRGSLVHLQDSDTSTVSQQGRHSAVSGSSVTSHLRNAQRRFALGTVTSTTPSEKSPELQVTYTVNATFLGIIDRG